jgi:hypothetical protein
LEM